LIRDRPRASCDLDSAIRHPDIEASHRADCGRTELLSGAHIEYGSMDGAHEAHPAQDSPLERRRGVRAPVLDTMEGAIDVANEDSVVIDGERGVTAWRDVGSQTDREPLLRIVACIHAAGSRIPDRCRIRNLSDGHVKTASR